MDEKNGAWKREKEQLFGKVSSLQQFINKHKKLFQLLTVGEVEALTLIAQGLDHVVIAKKLGVKSMTLQNCRSTK